MGGAKKLYFFSSIGLDNLFSSFLAYINGLNTSTDYLNLLSKPNSSCQLIEISLESNFSIVPVCLFLK
jgi:hypothetical protein